MSAVGQEPVNVEDGQWHRVSVTLPHRWVGMAIIDGKACPVTASVSDLGEVVTFGGMSIESIGPKR